MTNDRRFSMTAKTLPGLEEVLARELEALGAEEVRPGNLAASFSGDRELLYRTNLHLRTALRVLVPVASFRARDAEEIHRESMAVPWETWIGPDDTIAVDASVAPGSPFNPNYSVLKVKDAVADRFNRRAGRRPGVDTKNPTLRINLRAAGEDCVLSLDSSGESLHRRGYRLEKTEAPLSEVLAAGLLLLSGWEPEQPLLDPMCGSGTFLAEAGLMASRIPPGFLRRDFGFMGWRGFDRRLWERLRAGALASRRNLPAPIRGSDKDPEAVATARSNLARAGLEKQISVERRSFQETRGDFPPGSRGFLVMNPPYGKRLQDGEIDDLYKTIGDTLKRNYPDTTAWIFSSNLEAIRHIGLRPFTRIPLRNGPLECRFLGFRIFPPIKD